MVDTEGLEEGLIDGERDCDGAPARHLKLDGVHVEWADGVPGAGREVLRLSEHEAVWLRPTVGRLAVMGKNVELRVAFPLKEGEGCVIGETSVLTTVELVPDEARGEARMLVRVSFPVGDLLDGGEGLTDAGRGGSLVVHAHDEAGQGVGGGDASSTDVDRRWKGGDFEAAAMDVVDGG